MNSPTSDWREVAQECIYRFPEVNNLARENGDLATFGADLELPTLLYAYSHGLFPMYVSSDEMDPRKKMLGWFSPLSRAVIPLDGLRITRSMRKSFQKYECRIDTCFADVMRLCMTVPRHGGWITPDFIDAYTQAHEQGYAHSVEVFYEGDLVGGLYGIGFAGFFAGESMVHTMRDASKVALMHLVDTLNNVGGVLLDAQWMTPHLASLGARELPRSRYIEALNRSLEIDTIPWGS